MQESAKNIEDDAIAALLKSNPRAAIACIIQKYGGALYTSILKIVKTEAVAKDLFQDACVKIWKNADAYDPEKGRLFTWLLNIARNTALDKARTKKFKTQQTSENLETTVYDSIKHSEEMKIADVGLDRAMLKLDEKYRQVIDALYLQGYTQREATKVLGLPLGTLKTRAQTAIKKLREMIKEN